MKMSAYKISDNFNVVAGSKAMSPHHSHPTNGVRPSDSPSDSNGLYEGGENGYWDRYFEITNKLMVNPLPAIIAAPMAPVPKRWAPSTGGRAPACGSDNEWTSLPRAFGFGHGKNNPHRPLVRSQGFRNSSATAGLVLWGIGVWNFGVAIGALIGAAL